MLFLKKCEYYSSDFKEVHIFNVEAEFHRLLEICSCYTLNILFHPFFICKERANSYGYAISSRNVWDIKWLRQLER